MKEFQKEYRHKEWSLFTLEDFKVSSELLGSIDIGLIPLPTLLFQTGYLTLAEYDPQTDDYWLKFPNHEVKTALKLLNDCLTNSLNLEQISAISLFYIDFADLNNKISAIY
jgi:hypothetical protein